MKLACLLRGHWIRELESLRNTIEARIEKKNYHAHKIAKSTYQQSREKM